jgi:hypothetical protein
MEIQDICTEEVELLLFGIPYLTIYKVDLETASVLKVSGSGC